VPALALISSCQGDCTQNAVVAAERDGHMEDAPPGPNATDVSGSLGGAPYRLRYSAVSRGGAGDPRILVCAADIPVTFEMCMQSPSPPRTVLMAAFVYDGAGVPRWYLAETGIFRAGSSPLSNFARSGTISVAEDDPGAGVLRLTFSIDFGETLPATGTVSSP